MDNFNCNYVPGSSRLVRLMLISNSHLGYERCRFPKDLGVMLPEGGGRKGVWAVKQQVLNEKLDSLKTYSDPREYWLLLFSCSLVSNSLRLHAL